MFLFHISYHHVQGRYQDSILPTKNSGSDYGVMVRFSARGLGLGLGLGVGLWS